MNVAQVLFIDPLVDRQRLRLPGTWTILTQQVVGANMIRLETVFQNL